MSEINEQQMSESELLKAYRELQDNSVSKEKYENDISELKDKNRMYLEAITSGERIPTEEDGSSLEDLIKDLTKFKGTNLEYWEKTTKAIDKLLDRVPQEELLNTVGAEGVDEIIKVNNYMKELVNEADGSAEYFRTLYNNKIADSAPKISSEINSAGGLTNYLLKQN